MGDEETPFIRLTLKVNVPATRAELTRIVELAKLAAEFLDGSERPLEQELVHMLRGAVADLQKSQVWLDVVYQDA